MLKFATVLKSWGTYEHKQPPPNRRFVRHFLHFSLTRRHLRVYQNPVNHSGAGGIVAVRCRGAK